MSYLLYIQLNDGRFGFLNKTMRTKTFVAHMGASFFDLAYDEDNLSDVLSFISASAAEKHLKTLVANCKAPPILPLLNTGR